MVETTLRDALDGAKLVKFHDTEPLFVAWFGGVTFNVYSEAPDGQIREVDVFSLSDSKGRPVDQDRAEAKAAEILDNYGAERVE